MVCDRRESVRLYDRDKVCGVSNRNRERERVWRERERERERDQKLKRESNLRPGLSKTGRIFCTKK